MSDFELKLDQARMAYPLARVFSEMGHPPSGSGKFHKCPICDHADCSGLFEAKPGIWLFKCWHTSCPSGTADKGGAWDAIAYLAHVQNVSRKDAAVQYMKMAGVWVERDRLPSSVMPGKSTRKNRMPEEKKVCALCGDTGRVADGLFCECEIGKIKCEVAFDPAKAEAIVRFSQTFEVTPEILHKHGPFGLTEVQAWAYYEFLTKTGRITPHPHLSAAESAGVSLSPKESDSMLPTGSRLSSLDVAGIQTSSSDENASPPDQIPPSAPTTGNEAPLSESPAAAGIDAGSSVAAKPDQAPASEIVEPRRKKKRSNIIPLNGINEEEKQEREEDGGGGGGGNGGGSRGGGGNDDGGVPSVIRAIRYFYERLRLTREDQEELWFKRGLTEMTVLAGGFRSNLKENKAILESMAEHFPKEVLLDSGLWTIDNDGRGPRPSAQFYGFGMTGRKKRKAIRNADGEKLDEHEWDWTYPIIIPYFDEFGQVVFLRPHKGGAKGLPPRLFVVRASRAFRQTGFIEPVKSDNAYVTEGEFKAWALWQAVGPSNTYGALPGITMARPLFGDIEEWLADKAVKFVSVAYDNEEKGDDRLPGFKEDKEDRHDAEVWARFLALQLNKQGGFQTSVTHLPNSWRDDRGKADWDGVLARRIRHLAPSYKATETAEAWKLVGAKIHHEFQRVLLESTAIADLWSGHIETDDALTIIKKKVNYLMYEPMLPHGDSAEEAIAKKLYRLIRRNLIPAGYIGFLQVLAKQYRETKGRYYVLKPLTEKYEGVWKHLKEEATDKENVEIKRVCEIVLRGIPNPISNFYLKAKFAVNRPDAKEGKMMRMIVLRNVHGEETPLVPLNSSWFAQPARWREFLLECGGFVWKTGERGLNELQEDVSHAVKYNTVTEVSLRGYHQDSGVWFFDDAAFTDDEGVLTPNRHGIFWYRKKGYKLSDLDREQQQFLQGTPKMFPHKPDRPLTQYFQRIIKAFYQTLGGEPGYLALGVVLGFAAAPEMYKQESGYPGLWLHGATGQGKSCVARWMATIWGFKNMDTGTVLGDSTKVGLSILLQQYGNLPAWLEEYQPDAQKWMNEKIKNVYGRESGAKKTFGDGNREIIACAIVTGIATSLDAQIKNRYAHVLVAEKIRTGDWYDWLNKESVDSFYLLGRFILKYRRDYVKFFMKAFGDWQEDAQLAGVDMRPKTVHGVAYAGFEAMLGLLNMHDPETEDASIHQLDLAEYRKYLIDHCKFHVTEVNRQVNVNQFWQDILSGHKSNAFGYTAAELKKVWTVILKETAHPPGYPNQNARVWKTPYLYLQPEPVIEMLRAHKRKQGREVPLDRSDLQSQMKTKDYWVPPPKGSSHKQKFGGKSNESCWCINLDKHPLAFTPVTDEEFERSLVRNPDEPREDWVPIPASEWVDPRMGDMFSLVESILKNKEENVESMPPVEDGPIAAGS